MKMLLFFSLLLTLSINAQPNLKFELAYSGLLRPVDISCPNDGSDRLFIVEKSGTIKVIKDGMVLPTNFLNITSSVNDNGERGLLGLVFHPNYKENGFFFINYVNNNNQTTIARYKVSTNPDIADASSKKTVLQVQQPRSNHNAGDLNFSPIDGHLYIALGDGGGAGDPDCYSQDSTSMLGKILRISVNITSDDPPFYTVPNDNPFTNSPGVHDEIWALGLRNPWRVSFDKLTGDYWIADVGQGTHEEIDFVPAGASGGINFGWKVMEGNSCYSANPSCNGTSTPACSSSAYWDPLYEMNRSDLNGARSITGGYVYRGCKYPQLKGKYICTDYVTDNSWLISSTGTATLFKTSVEGVTSYGEDEKGELYIASIPDQQTGQGFIYRVVDDSEVKVLSLGTQDFPLSGTYRALDKIIVNGPLSQSLSDVKFIAPEIEFRNENVVGSTSSLIVTEDFCEQ
jgi:glucose/arabinose dehydrogenase